MLSTNTSKRVGGLEQVVKRHYKNGYPHVSTGDLEREGRWRRENDKEANDEFERSTKAAEERRPVLWVTSHRAREFDCRHQIRRKTKILTVAAGEQDPTFQRVMDGHG